MKYDTEGFPRPEIFWGINGTQTGTGDKYNMDTENGSSLSQATMEDNDRFVFAVPSPVYTWYRGGELLTLERWAKLGVSLISMKH